MLTDIFEKSEDKTVFVKRQVVVAFLLLFLFIVVQVTLGILVDANHHFFNVSWYEMVGSLLHAKGLANVWTPYPPFFSVLMLGLYTVSNLFSFLLVWKVLNVLTILSVGFVLYIIGKRLYSSTRIIWLTIAFLTLQATFTSKIAFGFFNDQFDNMVVLFLLLSVLLLFRGQITLSAVLLAVATLAKVFPVVVLLAVIWFLRGKDRWKYFIIFTSISILGILPFVIVGPHVFISSLHFMSDRGSWESIYTFPHIVSGYVLSAQEMITPYLMTSSKIDILLPIQLLVMLAFAVFVWRRVPRTEQNVLYVILMYLLIILLFAKGFSSYFIVWIFPLFFLLWKPLYAFILASGLLVVGNALYIHRALYWPAVFARHAFLVVLLVIVLRVLFTQTRRQRQFIQDRASL